MKTPRELLLQRHEHAEAELDAIRDGVMREHVKRGSGKRETIMTRAGEAGAFWRRSLWPSPKAWAGVAAAWVVILFLNFSDGVEADSSSMASAARRSPETLQALREQKRLLAELVNGPEETPEAERPRPVPRPRSEARPVVFAA